MASIWFSIVFTKANLYEKLRCVEPLFAAEKSSIPQKAQSYIPSQPEPPAHFSGKEQTLTN
jgi:hypothetical protein